MEGIVNLDTIKEEIEADKLGSGNVVNYVQYDGHPRNFYDLNVKEEDRQILELDFGNTPEKLKGDYLDMYEGIQSEVISTTRFDENSDSSTAYSGRIDITRTSTIKAEEKFPISEKGI